MVGNSNEKINFYESFFVRGARPMIMWIVAISLFLLYPLRIILEYANSLFGVHLLDDINYLLLEDLQSPIITLTITIVSIRTVEKLSKKHLENNVDKEYNLDNYSFKKEI